MSNNEICTNGLLQQECVDENCPKHGLKKLLPKVKLGLQPIRTYEHKKSGEDNWRAGTLRIYCGKLHVGFAEPIRNDTEGNYYFHSMLEDVSIGTFKAESLETILMNVELGLKEYIKYFVKIIN